MHRKCRRLKALQLMFSRHVRACAFRKNHGVGRRSTFIKWSKLYETLLYARRDSSCKNIDRKLSNCYYKSHSFFTKSNKSIRQILHEIIFWIGVHNLCIISQTLCFRIQHKIAQTQVLDSVYWYNFHNLNEYLVIWNFIHGCLIFWIKYFQIKIQTYVRLH